VAATDDAEETLTDILPGFPEKVEGEIVFCDADNINTDGIYLSRYMYQDNLATEKMAEVCMENYDSSFRDIARAGDVLVGASISDVVLRASRPPPTAILAKKIPPCLITEDSGETWSQKVGELPPNVREIIARGGLVKAEIEK